MGGDNSQTTTSGLNNSALNTAVSTIGSQLNSQLSKGVTPFSQSLYPGLSAQTTQGVNSLMGAAGNTGGLSQANNWARHVVSNNGYNSAMRDAEGQASNVGTQFGAMASGLSGPSAAQTGFSNMAAGARAPSLTESQLMNVAKGGAFGMQEPGYARMRESALNDALTGVASSFLTDGRFGSSVMGDAAGEAATETLAGLDYQNYMNDIARQERALGAIEGLRQQGFQNQFNALGASDNARLAQLGARSGALNSQLGAAGMASGIGQAAMGNAAGAAASLPGFYQAGLMPGQAMLAAGQVKDADMLATRQGAADLFDRTQNAGWNTLARASQVLAGTAPSAGQTTTQTQQQPWWQAPLQIGGTLAGAFF
jgi:hypothetical protein